MTKIVVVDKNIQSRENIEAILKNFENIEVVGLYDDFSQVQNE